MTKTLFIDASWKRWIAENALRGAHSEELVRVLVERGFDERHCRLEVETATSHPYLQAAWSISRQLSKRDWVLHNLRISAECRPPMIDELWNKIEPRTFADEYYALNRPVLLRGGVSGWPAIEKWTPEYLVEQLGDVEVEIEDCFSGWGHPER